MSYHRGARYFGLVREGAEDRQYAKELNPNYEQSSAARKSAVPEDIEARLEQMRPQWLLVWPSCEGVPAVVNSRLVPGVAGESEGGAKLYEFRRQD